MARDLAKKAVEYAIKVGAPFWFDGDLCVYVIDGEYPHCVVSGLNRRVMNDGRYQYHEFGSTGLARNLSLHAVGGGAQCVETLFGCVIYGGGCAVIVKGPDVNVIGRQTRMIKWDGTMEGRDRILDVLNDLGVCHVHE